MNQLVLGCARSLVQWESVSIGVGQEPRFSEVCHELRSSGAAQATREGWSWGRLKAWVCGSLPGATWCCGCCLGPMKSASAQVGQSLRFVGAH